MLVYVPVGFLCEVLLINVNACKYTSPSCCAPNSKKVMAQQVDEFQARTDDSPGQVQDTQFDLQRHLSKYNVCDRVYKLLCHDSITVDELITFTNSELKDWCDENHLRIIEKKRFVNAIKSLPNSQATQHDEPKIVPIFLGNEEQEQLSQFDKMEKSITNLMNYISEIENKSNVEKVVQEINDACDEIQSFVETLRKNLLHQVFWVYFKAQLVCFRKLKQQLY